MRLLFSSLFFVATTQALDNGLARTPQMGWNTWNKFGCNIKEDLIRQSTDAIVTSGLAAVGYKYINLDDCWQKSRDANGTIVADPNFPSGIKALADYVHSKNLLFGLYSDAGLLTCQGRPGGWQHEKSDANTYAEWGVDYLKYDNCFNLGLDAKIRYPPMHDALNATGRPILFSMCEWGQEDPATFAPALANSWRTTNDISNSWSSVLTNLDLNDKWHSYAGPGQWNDPDMLEVGNGVLTLSESIAHFSLWCLIKSPLIIGNDVTNMSAETLSILNNTEAIAVNQDALGVQGYKRRTSNGIDLWAGALSGESGAVVLLNRNTASGSFSFNLTEIDLVDGRQYTVRDLWLKKDLGVTSSSWTSSVDGHGAVMLRLNPTNVDGNDDSDVEIA